MVYLLIRLRDTDLHTTIKNLKQQNMKSKPDKELLNLMTKNPDNWKGPFYFNHKDPRIVVPKFNSLMGWTVNCAHPGTYIILAVVILVIVASKYLL